MGSRVVPTTATPDPRWFNTNEGTGRSTVRSQAIVMSAGRQIRQASKQTIKNEQCGSNPPKGSTGQFPQYIGFGPSRGLLVDNCQLGAEICFRCPFSAIGRSVRRTTKSTWTSPTANSGVRRGRLATAEPSPSTKPAELGAAAPPNAPASSLQPFNWVPLSSLGRPQRRLPHR